MSSLVATAAHFTDRRPLWPSVLMFVYGAGWSFSLNSIGYVYGAELVALMFLPFVGVIGAMRRYALLRSVLVAYAFILAGLIVADIANQTPFELALKGWATPASGAVCLMFVVALLDRNPNAIFGFFVGLILFTLVLGPETYAVSGRKGELAWQLALENSNIFKIRIVPFLLPLLVLCIQYLQPRSRVLAGVFAIVGVVAFALFGARSAALILFVVAIASTFISPLRKIASGKLLMIAALGAAIGYLGFAAYVNYSLASGGDGHSAQQLARIDSPYNPLELLGIGRSEWLTAPAVISERPIFGYGSWAYDTGGHFTFLRATLTNEMQAYHAYYAHRLQLVPAHSVLLTSWIWGGLIGFWGALLLGRAITRGVAGTFRPGAPLMVIGVYLAITVLWDFLFSPFQTIRLNFPHGIGFMIVIHSIVPQIENRNFKTWRST